MSESLGPGVPLAEIVRLATVGRRVCVAAFETLGQRSATAENSAARLGVAEVSRQIGETLVFWESLLPDAVGLQALADDVAAEFEASTALATFRRDLADRPLGPAARAVVRALRREVATVSAECSPVADGEFMAVLAEIAVRLGHAERAADSALGDQPTPSLDQDVTLLLAGTRKTFSSPLPVPNEQSNNHWTWQ